MSTTKPSPSIAMLELQREKNKDRLFTIIIIAMAICWTFSLYMVFSFFANNTYTSGSGETSNYIQDTSGNNNTIEQKG